MILAAVDTSTKTKHLVVVVRCIQREQAGQVPTIVQLLASICAYATIEPNNIVPGAGRAVILPR
jgi:hypothetical protein